MKPPASAPVSTAPGGLSTVPLRVEPPFVYPAVYPGAVFGAEKIAEVPAARAQLQKSSDLPPKADIAENDGNVRFVPKADTGIGSNPSQKSGGRRRTVERL